jgi:4-hydroxybenzoate polyprenyltransferase
VSNAQGPFSIYSRLKLFLALSRTPHGLLDMATPPFAALLWLGAFPPFWVMALGMITTFAGYTAVYALNDIYDYRLDREKVCGTGYICPDNYLDAVMIMHPMAHGCLSFRAGLAWATCWAIVAVSGAYMLNPVCVIIFMAGCFLEAVYCGMWKVSPLRTLVSGGVKTSGAVAAVFAVDPYPSTLFLTVLILALLSWEIGGQNIPADWTDLEADRDMGAKTVPVIAGRELSSRLIVITLGFSIGLTALLFQLPKTGPAPLEGMISVVVGICILMYPAYRLLCSQSRQDAMRLFNLASHYPAALLMIVLFGFTWKG